MVYTIDIKVISQQVTRLSYVPVHACVYLHVNVNACAYVCKQTCLDLFFVMWILWASELGSTLRQFPSILTAWKKDANSDFRWINTYPDTILDEFFARMGNIQGLIYIQTRISRKTLSKAPILLRPCSLDFWILRLFGNIGCEVSEEPRQFGCQGWVEMLLNKLRSTEVDERGYHTKHQETPIRGRCLPSVWFFEDCVGIMHYRHYHSWKPAHGKKYLEIAYVRVTSNGWKLSSWPFNRLRDSWRNDKNHPQENCPCSSNWILENDVALGCYMQWNTNNEPPQLYL